MRCFIFHFQFSIFHSFNSFIVESDCVSCHFLQADTSDGGTESAEISLAQLFAESDSFENLCTAIRADSGNPHLTHDFEQTFADRFDIVFLSGSIVQLNIFLFYQRALLHAFLRSLQSMLSAHVCRQISDGDARHLLPVMKG